MIRRFAKDAAIYALPMFLARAIGLILLPIYTRQLGPADFGFVEFVAAASAILQLVLPLEINQAVGRLLPESDDQSRQKNILSSALGLTIFAFSIFGGLVYLFRFQLLGIVNLPSQYAQYAALVCIHFLVLAIVNLLQVQFRFTSQAKSSVAINMAVVFTNLGLVLYFSAMDRLGIEQYFLSQIVAGLTGGSIGLLLLTKKYGPLYGAIDFPILRELFKFSLPIVLSSIGVVLSSTVDRLMVGGYVGLTELGYYGVAARFAAIVGLGFYVISTAMTPMVYREHAKNETKLLIVRIFKATSYGSLILLLVTAVFSEQLVVLLAGEKFSQGAQYIFYLLLSAILANLYIFFLGMDIEKKTKLLSKINLVSGMLGAIGSVLFVPLIGIWGAIISALLANAVRLGGYVYYSQKSYPILITIPWAQRIVVGLAILILGASML